ncbi:MAG: hypothetical protein SP1CHLAM54_04310 [Chlamydiia bacterium]|nr:hypothetical protein [Chlamydiia bacterium]MCH9615345.1 hypothetical protein [Chlamydiia bacterium]MCH9628333.1 hypothetical protein [Chlamydiia bacterium]
MTVRGYEGDIDARGESRRESRHGLCVGYAMSRYGHAHLRVPKVTAERVQAAYTTYSRERRAFHKGPSLFEGSDPALLKWKFGIKNVRHVESGRLSYLDIISLDGEFAISLKRSKKGHRIYLSLLHGELGFGDNDHFWTATTREILQLELRHRIETVWERRGYRAYHLWRIERTGDAMLKHRLGRWQSGLF